MIVPQQEVEIQPSIESMILNIRGQQVMLDRDLARLYGVETRRLNEQVKRNIERFPEDFMFQLTKEECSRAQIATLNDSNLISQNATSNWGGTRKPPYAFTENGIAMLSSVLRSPTAIEVNIKIMRAFVAMRRFLSNNAHLFSRIETLEHQQLAILNRQDQTDRKIDRIFHDRFLIIDETVYHIGASLKDLGKKVFGFTLMGFITPEKLFAQIR